MAARLRRAGHADQIRKLLEMGARARAGRPWDAVVAAVDHLCAGATSELGPDVPTVEKFAKDWTSGELSKKYPDHVKAKRTHDRDEITFRLYINPVVRDVRLDEFTLDDAE